MEASEPPRQLADKSVKAAVWFAHRRKTLFAVLLLVILCPPLAHAEVGQSKPLDWTAIIVALFALAGTLLNTWLNKKSATTLRDRQDKSEATLQSEQNKLQTMLLGRQNELQTTLQSEQNKLQTMLQSKMLDTYIEITKIALTRPVSPLSIPASNTRGLDETRSPDEVRQLGKEIERLKLDIQSLSSGRTTDAPEQPTHQIDSVERSTSHAEPDSRR